jgi:uncharacterized protein (DUF1697 family)
MSLHVALFRGVNVGGHQLVAMADLRERFARLGLGGARTLLQSGNVVFESEGRTAAELEALLDREAARGLGLTTTCHVRTAREWRSVIADNPFPAAAREDPGRLIALFVRRAPAPGALRALRAAIVDREEVRAVGRQLYLTYPDGIGRSRLTPAIIDAKLGERGTARNWNTVLKVGALALA